VVEIGVNNPTDAELTLEVALEGHGLSGPSELVLAPRARCVYQVTFAPTAVGQHDGGSVLCALLYVKN